MAQTRVGGGGWGHGEQGFEDKRDDTFTMSSQIIRDFIPISLQRLELHFSNGEPGTVGAVVVLKSCGRA